MFNLVLLIENVKILSLLSFIVQIVIIFCQILFRIIVWRLLFLNRTQNIFLALNIVY